MVIESAIIHEIKKEVDIINETRLILSNELLDISNQVIIDLLQSLEQSFSKKTISRAKFSDEGFRETIQNINNLDMIGDTKHLTQRLRDRIDSIVKAKGGYLLFAKYRTTQDFLAIFLLRETKGSRLTRNDNQGWDLDSIQYLDIEHFAMGAKINLTILNSESEDRYISLVRGNTDISHYFESWIGLAETQQEDKDATLLYEIANNIDLPEGMSRDSFKKAIYDYAKGLQNQLFNIREFSRYCFSDENYISNYCELKNIDLNGEFRLKGKNLKKFYSISVSHNGIELKAPFDRFHPNSIEIENGKIIIYSEELVRQVQEELGQ